MIKIDVILDKSQKQPNFFPTQCLIQEKLIHLKLLYYVLVVIYLFIFQNQSAAGNVIQLTKKKSLMYDNMVSKVAIWNNKFMACGREMRSCIEFYIMMVLYSLQWRIQDFPLGGGGANLRHVHFLAKMYAKTKEIDPVGGGRALAAPPGSANGLQLKLLKNGKIFWYLIRNKVLEATVL